LSRLSIIQIYLILHSLLQGLSTEHNLIFKISVQRYIILTFLAIRQNWLLTD